jgi:hypothetical protein
MVTELTILKVEDIGNMVSIPDMKIALTDAMSRCTIDSDVYNTYDAVLTMITVLSNNYDAELN